MPSVLMLTAFLLREEGEGGGLLKISTSRWGALNTHSTTFCRKKNIVIILRQRGHIFILPAMKTERFKRCYIYLIDVFSTLSSIFFSIIHVLY